ncbi:hypothetical protein BV581_06310 [Stutzerimonas stutzeri]|nr:hypothetical protein BV581_06310 [Stutzerimonas stutzeri]
MVVTTAVTKDQLTEALTCVKEWLEDDQHEQAEVAVHGDHLKLTVKYQKLDLSQAEFRQVVEKTAEVILEKQGSGWKITGPMNDKFKDITDQLYSQIEIVTDQDVATRTISLEAIPDAGTRTNFLRSLIRNIKGMEVVDVVDVSTFNPKDQEDDDLDLSDDALVIEESIEVESEDEGEEGNPEAELARPQPEARVHKIIRIDKASLKGKGVLESKQLLELEGHGFYLWKIRWKAREKLVGAELVLFEAQFGNQAKYCDFSYIVKGVYNYNHGKYAKNLVRAEPVFEQKLKIRLEEAAQKTLDDIERSLTT